MAAPASLSAQGGTLRILDVPFLAQTEDLCGGASAAMLLRYWGRTDVQPEDFASFVDHEKGGIRASDLLREIGNRGLVAHSLLAGVDDLLREIERGRPVLALIDGGHGRLHYVVIVGSAPGRFLFHDPAIGAFRVKTVAEFTRLWKASENWAVVAWGESRNVAAPAPAETTVSRAPTPCDSLIDPAIATARGADPEQAVPPLLAAVDLCPKETRALNALAGVRFRQERWPEVSEFARQATERNASDVESWRLLATSLYLDDRPALALRAWNRIGEPTIDTVEIDGLVRTRQDRATAILGLRAREVLTTSSLQLAQRRLDHLPTSGEAKVTYRPAPGGRARVIASAAEASLVEPFRFLAPRIAIEGAAKREIKLTLNSPTGRGEALEVGGRFARHRPAVWMTLETPRLAGLPGVVALGGLWDRQTYRLGGVSTALVETRRRGFLEWSHWVVSSTRVDVGLGIDRFHGRGTYGSVRGGIDHRRFGDRLALLASTTRWSSSSAGGFGDWGGAIVFRSSAHPKKSTAFARFEGRRVSSTAPLAVWPSAGKGAGRGWLLRGSRLVRDGVVTGEAFAPGLLHATIEAERNLLSLTGLRIGIAAFLDWAKAWNPPYSAGFQPGIVSVGMGVRLRGPGSSSLRVDVARRPGHSGALFTAGIIPPWPRQ